MGPLLNAACRTGSTDTCFRYGGEEFSILLAETSLEEALTVAERVRKSIDEYPFSVKIAHPFEKVTVSLGLAIMDQKSVKSYSELIHDADVALYRSKEMGKNRVTCYSEALIMPGLKLDAEPGIR
jgi:diguanylate cyclase (GGDEF)-like protein